MINKSLNCELIKDKRIYRQHSPGRFLRTMVAVIWAVVIGVVPVTGFAADEPHEAILAAVQTFRDNDIRSLVIGSIGEEEFDKMASEWIEERDNRLAEITDEDRAAFTAQMGLLTADGAEDAIMALLSPQLALWKEQSAALVPMIQGLGALQIEQMEGATDEGTQRLNQVLQALADWAQSTDIASEELARQAVGIATRTARDLDIAALDDLAGLEFDEVLERGGTILTGVREILSIYGLSLDETLESFHAETIANDGTTATVKNTFTILGAPMDVETEYVLVDEKWLSKDAIEQSQKMAEFRDAMAAAESAEAEMSEQMADESDATMPAESLPAGSNGYFRKGDVRVDFAHVYAFLTEDNSNPDKFETIVILADRELDSNAMGEFFDPLDGAQEQIREQGGLVRIVVGSDGSERGLYFVNTEPSASFNTSGGNFKVTVSSRDRIEGSWSVPEPQEFFDETYEFSLAFAADVSDAQLRGDALPAGGGEAGDAYLAKMHALIEGDVGVLREMLGESAQWQLPESYSEEEIAESIKFMRYGWPVEATVTGGLDRGDVAILRVVGKDEEGQTLSGRVMMQKTDQGWEDGAIDLDTLYNTELSELLAAATEEMVEPTVADEPDPSEIAEDAIVEDDSATTVAAVDPAPMAENDSEALQSTLDRNPFLTRYQLGLTVMELVDGFATIELTSAPDALIQQARSGVDLLSVDVSMLDSDQDRLAVTALRKTLDSVSRKNNLEAILLVAPPISEEELARLAEDEAMAKKEAENAARADQRKRLIRQIQIELTELGYDPGPADGIAGRGTRDVIADYQDAAGMDVDGVPSDELLVHLQSSDAVHKEETVVESEDEVNESEMQVTLDETEHEEPADESVEELAEEPVEEPEKKPTLKGLLDKLLKRNKSEDDVGNSN